MAAATTVLACVTACILASCSESLPVDEPRCLKFDFEEQLLEKMVRMEHSGGVMMEEFRESKKISNDQELIQSDPISCPQNQKGNN